MGVFRCWLLVVFGCCFYWGLVAGAWVDDCCSCFLVLVVGFMGVVFGYWLGYCWLLLRRLVGLGVGTVGCWLVITFGWCFIGYFGYGWAGVGIVGLFYGL